MTNNNNNNNTTIEQTTQRFFGSVDLDVSGPTFLYDNERKSDVTIQLKDETTIKAHSVILASRSTVFRRMYFNSSEFKEGISNVLEMKDDEPQHVRIFIKLLYSLPLEHSQKHQPLYSMFATVDDVCCVYSIAYRYEARESMRYCTWIIFSIFEKLCSDLDSSLEEIKSTQKNGTETKKKNGVLPPPFDLMKIAEKQKLLQRNTGAGAVGNNSNNNNNDNTKKQQNKKPVENIAPIHRYTKQVTTLIRLCQVIIESFKSITEHEFSEVYGYNKGIEHGTPAYSWMVWDIMKRDDRETVLPVVLRAMVVYVYLISVHGHEFEVEQLDFTSEQMWMLVGIYLVVTNSNKAKKGYKTTRVVSVHGDNKPIECSVVEIKNINSNEGSASIVGECKNCLQSVPVVDLFISDMYETWIVDDYTHYIYHMCDESGNIKSGSTSIRKNKLDVSSPYKTWKMWSHQTIVTGYNIDMTSGSKKLVKILLNKDKICHFVTGILKVFFSLVNTQHETKVWELNENDKPEEKNEIFSIIEMIDWSDVPKLTKLTIKAELDAKNYTKGKRVFFYKSFVTKLASVLMNDAREQRIKKPIVLSKNKVEQKTANLPPPSSSIGFAMVFDSNLVFGNNYNSNNNNSIGNVAVKEKKRKKTGPAQGRLEKTRKKDTDAKEVKRKKVIERKRIGKIESAKNRGFYSDSSSSASEAVEDVYDWPFPVGISDDLENVDEGSSGSEEEEESDEY